MFDPSNPPLFRSTWYSETEIPAAVPAGPTIAHPYSVNYQEQTSQSSTTSATTEEGVIQTVERLIPRTETGMVLKPVTRPTQTKISHVSRNVTSVIANPSRLSNVVEVQVTNPKPSAPVSPTSILMHPWHERDKRQRQSKGENFDLKTMKTGEQFSYTVQGLSFPKPPVVSPISPTQRYSSSTLASTADRHEGGEGRKKKVHLLTFASVYRSSVTK